VFYLMDFVHDEDPDVSEPVGFRTQDRIAFLCSGYEYVKVQMIAVFSAVKVPHLQFHHISEAFIFAEFLKFS